MAFQQGDSLYARYRTALFFASSPANQSGLFREKGDYVGQYTGDMQFSQDRYEWMCRLRVPVLDDDLVSMTTALFWVPEVNLINGPYYQYTPGSTPPAPPSGETPAGTGTPGGGGQPQPQPQPQQTNPPPAPAPAGKPAPTTGKPSPSPTPAPGPSKPFSFLSAVGTGGKSSGSEAGKLPAWGKIGAGVLVVALLSFAAWQLLRKN